MNAIQKSLGIVKYGDNDQWIVGLRAGGILVGYWCQDLMKWVPSSQDAAYASVWPSQDEVLKYIDENYTILISAKMELPSRH
jgi:hypothetical protein